MCWHLTGQTQNALRVHCRSAESWCRCKQLLFVLGSISYLFCLSVYQSIFISLVLLTCCDGYREVAESELQA